MEKSIQMNEVEITKTVNCLIKSLESPPTCDAKSINSPVFTTAKQQLNQRAESK